MIFKFLTYLQPIHYFSLKRSNGSSVFPAIDDLPKAVRDQLVENYDYTSELARYYDLSWQALHKGYIGDAKTIIPNTDLPLVDDYIFSRTYFSSYWVFYVLCVRILCFYNPFKELKAFYGSRKTKRSTYLKTPIAHADWTTFNSSLLDSQPKVSVIIPTLNRYVYLKDVLEDLEKQNYKNFEVIIIDQSEPFQKKFYDSSQLEIQVVHQMEKALWLARNSAIKMSKSDYLLFFDDDSRVDSEWIENHLKCLDFFKADISSGVSISKVGAKVPEHYKFFRISDQLDTGNVLIKRNVFEKIGLFDRQFEKQRMGDGEFGLRAYLNSNLNVSNPCAKRLHLKVGYGGLREMGSWDAFRTKKWFAPRPIPSVLYLFKTYFGARSAKLALMRTVPLSIMPYRFKKNKAMMIIGVFVSILILPIIVFQVYKSWRMSSKMISNGALIESLP